MSHINPLVKASGELTLNEIINTMQYVSGSLDLLVLAASTEDEVQTHMTAAQAAGLRNMIDSMQQAAEECFGQFRGELATKLKVA
ncbi:MAG: hypothetical protein ACI9FJ_003317 [Alteromonadaceae bacterium]|jgi:hypothetical protein